MIALGEGGIISSLERAALEKWLKSKHVHWSQASDGSTLVCLSSLLAHLQKTKIR